MRVAYFSNHFAAAGGHGVSRYSRSLFQALRDYHPELDLLPCATWSNLPAAERKAMEIDLGLETMPWGRKLTPLAWTFLNYPPIEKWLHAPVELVHMIALNFPVATKKPLVITVHDIGPLTHPQYFSISPPWLQKRSVAFLVRHADAIICVSQATADELAQYARRIHQTNLTSRIQVVHEGVEHRLFEPVDETCLSSLTGVPNEPFLLTVGAISPRKNIQGVLRALAKLGNRIPHHLVAAGGSGWDMDEVHDLINQPSLKGRVHLLGYVSDEQLQALYQRATAYLHPSLFEGFGLTVLEAMAAGSPVITSNVFSLPEVAGDAALLVDPTDFNQIAEAIETLCLDPGVRQALVEKGKNRARDFTWKKCAAGVDQVYRSLL